MYSLTIWQMNRLFNLFKESIKNNIYHFKIEDLVDYIDCAEDSLLYSLDYWSERNILLYNIFDYNGKGYIRITYLKGETDV